MSSYPINLDLEGKPCAVIGGGRIAARKVSALLRAQACVTVISPCLTESLLALWEQKAVRHRKKYYVPGDLEGFFLVICAADDAAVNRRAAAEAEERGILFNVVDASYKSDFTTPAQVRRGRLLLTVSTDGLSPALSRAIRTELEGYYAQPYGVYLETLAAIRGEVKASCACSAARVRFWQEAMRPELLALVRQGKLEKAEAELRNAIGGFGLKS